MFITFMRFVTNPRTGNTTREVLIDKKDILEAERAEVPAVDFMQPDKDGKLVPIKAASRSEVDQLVSTLAQRTGKAWVVVGDKPVERAIRDSSGRDTGRKGRPTWVLAPIRAVAGADYDLSAL